MLAVLFVCALLLIVLGAPVALALAGSSLLFIMVSGQMPDLLVIHRMVEGIDSFPLIAIPFFILAGSLMNSAGITAHIFDFAKALVGWMRGGLGHVNIGASVVFAGMSGAAVADAGGLGTIEIRAMRDAGYDVEFAVGVPVYASGGFFSDDPQGSLRQQLELAAAHAYPAYKIKCGANPRDDVARVRLARDITGAVDVINPDINLCGGPWEARMIAALAAAQGIRVSPHVFGGAIGLAVSLHYAASLPASPHVRYVPYPVLVEYDYWENGLCTELLRAPLVPVNGQIAVPQGPGLGIELDLESVRRFAV